MADIGKELTLQTVQAPEVIVEITQLGIPSFELGFGVLPGGDVAALRDDVPDSTRRVLHGLERTLEK